jgi:GNAT superfamily N-acetyltransferase
MKLIFVNDINIGLSLCFDRLYEKELQISEEEKQDLLKGAIRAFMFVDGKLAGESYGKQLKDLDEEIPDCSGLDPRSIYCYSTTIMPAMRGKGLAKLLKAYWLGMCRGEARDCQIVGHSTSEQMKHINELFGANHAPEPHENWFGSKRKAWFYKMPLLA